MSRRYVVSIERDDDESGAILSYGGYSPPSYYSPPPKGPESVVEPPSEPSYEESDYERGMSLAERWIKYLLSSQYAYRPVPAFIIAYPPRKASIISPSLSTSMTSPYQDGQDGSPDSKMPSSKSSSSHDSIYATIIGLECVSMMILLGGSLLLHWRKKKSKTLDEVMRRRRS